MLKSKKQNMIHKGKWLIFSLLLVSYGAFGQTTNTIFNESRKLMALSINMDYGLYRDFSTSPLFYKMPGVGFAASGIYSLPKAENRFDIEGDFLYWNALFIRINSYYHYIHKIPVFKSEKWDLKVGGAFTFTQNFRSNSALQNAQIGYESFANVMVVGKISRDLSRLEPKDYKCWFLKGTKKAIKRLISFQLNVGILNFNHRPSTYNYVYLGSINGTELSLSEFFDEYQWKLNGWRFGTQIEYSWYYPSGNGRKIAYIWEAAHAPGTFEPFQMASHKLQFTILINNKKR